MQQPQNRSVSDIYGHDEIDFLLDEIRDLSPACCQEDLQDFDIAGSRAGEVTITPPLESPLETCSSWDSHLNYRERLGQAQLAWGVTLHCDTSHLKSPTGIVRILLVVSKHSFLASPVTRLTFSNPFVDLISLLPSIRMLRRYSTSWTFFTAIDWTTKIDGKFSFFNSLSSSSPLNACFVAFSD